MGMLDPEKFTEQLAKDLPDDILDSIVLIGSLAAAYHYRKSLGDDGVQTKDADLLIQPRESADVKGRQCARRLLQLKWNLHLPHGPAQESPDPTDRLPAIRLFPPQSKAYFVEFLTVPESTCQRMRDFLPIQLHDGWYALPSLKYLSLMAWMPLRTKSGICYSRPSMMALSNILSHPTLSKAVMSSPYGGRRIRRCNKDLGRVLAMAWLEDSVDGFSAWGMDWSTALSDVFPGSATELKTSVAEGIERLLASESDFEEAWHTCAYSLLARTTATRDGLKIVAEELLQKLLRPFSTE